jgi:phosphate uptake regulator
MKRKIIKQRDSYTVTLPIKWVKENNISKDDEVDVEIDENNLVISLEDAKKQIKKAEITIDPSVFGVYRSLIGGLYRGGYDEVTVDFKDPRVLSDLQKTIDQLDGFELLDITKNSGVIRSVFSGEQTELRQHISKLVNIIKTIQHIILDDINKRKFDSEQDLKHLKDTGKKQRDIISRIILKNRLFDNKHFPFYHISICLWIATRHYFYMYQALPKNYKADKAELDYFNKVSEFFNTSFEHMDSKEFIKRHERYLSLQDYIFKLSQTKKKLTPIQSYCKSILILAQSCDSMVLSLSN